VTCMYTAGYTEQPSRGEVVFTELKARLLAGEFPLGARLGEERLAGLLDVSRTPVREALHRLHTEGFVQRHADGGFTPTVPDVSASLRRNVGDSDGQATRVSSTRTFRERPGPPWNTPLSGVTSV